MLDVYYTKLEEKAKSAIDIVAASSRTLILASRMIMPGSRAPVYYEIKQRTNPDAVP